MNNRLPRYIFTLSLMFLPGCGGSAQAPKIAPRECAERAMAEYDANKDGRLDEKELEQCPALASVRKDLDKSKDGALDADELEERLKLLLDSNASIVSVGFQVVRSGVPVKDAKVTFVPEKFMGPSFHAAKGVSTATGQVELKLDEMPVPGVPCGYYKVEVSMPDGSGQETLAPRWHSDTKLGYEVSPFMRGIIRIDLGS